MKNKIKKLFKYISIFFLLICIYISLLVLTAKIPKSLIINNIENSVEQLLKSSIFYRETYTDAVMLDLCYNSDENTPLESSLKNVVISNYEDGLDSFKDYDGVSSLVADITGSEVEYNNKIIEYKYYYNYARYWHGYLIFLRPLLILFNYNQISILCGIVFFILVVYLEKLIKEKIGLKETFFIGISLILMGYITLWESISLVPTILIMMIFSIVILKTDKDKSKDNIITLFLINGSVTAYFCWMNFTLVTLCLPLLLYYLLNKKYDVIEFFKIIITYLLSFIITWGLKWIIVDIFCGTNIIRDGINQVIFRAKSIDPLGKNITLFKTIIKQLYYYSIGMIITYFYLVIRILKEKAYFINISIKDFIKNNKNKIIIYNIIALLPFGVYALTMNHSFVHAEPYTHRMLSITTLCIILLFEDFINYTKVKNIN